jgi:hypothetical protein
MTKVKKPKTTKAQLRHKIKELEAQLASTYHFAGCHIGKTSTDHLMGSGVLLELTLLGGRQAIPPVVIRDGLSKETIEAIKADMRRSYDLAVAFKPV